MSFCFEIPISTDIVMSVPKILWIDILSSSFLKKLVYFNQQYVWFSEIYLTIEMEKLFVVLFVYLVSFRSRFCHEEPTCSKYHFEEKVLEKVVRFEHKMEIITDSVNNISTKVKDDIQNMKTELETRGSEQTNAFNKLSEKLETKLTELTQNINTEWTGIKNDFELMKHDVVEQKRRLNATIQQELHSLQSSFELLSGMLNNFNTLVAIVGAFRFYVLSFSSNVQSGTF